MAEVERHVRATPQRVFEVLSDGWRYANWVVGISHIAAVEPTWPSNGSTIYHVSGIWPLVTRDESYVEEVDPGRRIVIMAKGMPFGAARIRLDLVPDGAGTLVSMFETPVSGPGKWLHNPLIEALLTKRNAECLHRLAAVVEEHDHPNEADAGP